MSSSHASGCEWAALAGRLAGRLLVIEPAATDADTLAVLAALRPIDWVVQADGEARARLVAEIRPDILLAPEPAR